MDYTQYTEYPITPRSTVYVGRLKTHFIFQNDFIFINVMKQNTYKCTDFVIALSRHYFMLNSLACQRS